MKFKNLLKYKFSILFILVGLLFLWPFREGFVGDLVGEYDFLKPLPGPTALDSTTESNFVMAFNNANKSYSKIKADTNYVTQLKNNVTQDEFDYYIKNNKWPYGSYIATYLNTNLTRISPNLTAMFSPDTPTVDLIQQVFPTRVAYMMFAQSQEIKQTPKPETVDIYLGTQTTPEASAPTTSLSAQTTPGASAPTTSLSGDTYAKLQSVCASLH